MDVDMDFKKNSVINFVQDSKIYRRCDLNTVVFYFLDDIILLKSSFGFLPVLSVDFRCPEICLNTAYYIKVKTEIGCFWLDKHFLLEWNIPGSMKWVDVSNFHGALRIIVSYSSAMKLTFVYLKWITDMVFVTLMEQWLGQFIK